MGNKSPAMAGFYTTGSQQSLSVSSRIRPKGYFLTVATGFALLFALISHQQQLPLWQHGVLWALQGLSPLLLLPGCQHWLDQRRLLRSLPAVVKLLLGGACAGILFSGPAMALDIWFGLDPLPRQAADWFRAFGQEALTVTPVLSLCWLATNAPWLPGWPAAVSAIPHPPAAVAEIQPQAASLADTLAQGCGIALPSQCQGQLLYIKAELHYLLLVTTQGQSLVLCSLKDAIAALPVTAGLSPHRSYWVSFSAIRGLRRQGRQGILTLSHGHQIPVSRQQLASVRQRLQTQGIESSD